MPHTKSAKKSVRQDAKRRERNRDAKKAMKVQLKKFVAALKSGTNDEAQTEFNNTAKLIDKAGVRRIMHPNTAARKKSLLARKLHAKKSAPPAPAKAE